MKDELHGQHEWCGSTGQHMQHIRCGSKIKTLRALAIALTYGPREIQARCGLADWCRPTTAGMMTNMFWWSTDCNMTIRWPLRLKFSEAEHAGIMVTDGPSTAQNLAQAQGEPQGWDYQYMWPSRDTQSHSHAQTAYVDQRTVQTTHMTRAKCQQRNTWLTRGVPIAYA